MVRPVEAGTEAKKTEARRRLSWKDLLAITISVTVMLGTIMGIAVWVHAESTIPKILRETQQQVEKAIERHSARPHVMGAAKDELDDLKKDLTADVARVERQIESFKSDTGRQLERIENKLDAKQ